MMNWDAIGAIAARTDHRRPHRAGAGGTGVAETQGHALGLLLLLRSDCQISWIAGSGAASRSATRVAIRRGRGEHRLAVLSDSDILSLLKRGALRIEGFREENLTPNGYDVTIEEIWIPGRDSRFTEGAAEIPGREWFVI